MSGLVGLLIVVIIIVIVLYGFWLFMQWEFNNANRLKIGLVNENSGLAYSTVMPDWVNDAWRPTMFEILYKEAKWGF